MVAHVVMVEEAALSALLSAEHVVAELIADVLSPEQSDETVPTEVATVDAMAAHDGSKVAP